MNDHVKSEPIRRFCVLQYTVGKTERDQPDNPTIIALMTSSRDGEFAIRVHPDWEKIVLSSDREYIKALYEDFRMRIRSDPETLFRQLSDLSVGPLITYEAGPDLSAFPAYVRMTEWFQKI